MNLTAIFFLPHQPQFAAFNDVRKKIYGNDCTPDEINRQYLITCLLVYSNSEPVARLCLYHNPAIGRNKTLLFGNIEWINQDKVFDKLMSEAENYARQNEFKILLGPINGSTWDDYRLPLTNEGCQYMADLNQPLYYAEHLQQSRYEIAERYYTQQSKLIHKEIDKILEEKLQKQGISIRSITINEYENELEKLYPFCLNAFSENVYYSVINKSDFLAKYKKIKALINPEFVLIAEDANQQIVAFLFCLPDVYHSNTIVMKTMARNKNTQLNGLMTHLINMLYSLALAAGYTQLLHAFYHEKNRSGILSEKYDGKPFKSYALFQKKLSD